MLSEEQLREQAARVRGMVNTLYRNYRQALRDDFLPQWGVITFVMAAGAAWVAHEAILAWRPTANLAQWTGGALVGLLAFSFIFLGYRRLYRRENVDHVVFHERAYRALDREFPLYPMHWKDVALTPTPYRLSLSIADLNGSLEAMMKAVPDDLKPFVPGRGGVFLAIALSITSAGTATFLSRDWSNVPTATALLWLLLLLVAVTVVFVVADAVASRNSPR